MKKIALDEAAKKYWKMLFKELGYGEALVRDIPRRIKAALVDNKKVAGVDASAVIIPVAHAVNGESRVIEGIYSDGSRSKLLFRAALDSRGDVTDIRTIAIRG
jgi:hypothetical protein